MSDGTQLELQAAPDLDVIIQLEQHLGKFTKLNRRMRGFMATLANQLARTTARMAEKIDPLKAEHDVLGLFIAKSALSNRQLIASGKNSVMFGNGIIVFYDGGRGEFKILDNDKLALRLIELNHRNLVSIDSKVVYTINRAELKKLVMQDPVLRKQVTADKMAAFAENKSVTVMPHPTPSEKKEGITPEGYVYHYES